MKIDEAVCIAIEDLPFGYHLKSGAFVQHRHKDLHNNEDIDRPNYYNYSTDAGHALRALRFSGASVESTRDGWHIGRGFLGSSHESFCLAVCYWVLCDYLLRHMQDDEKLFTYQDIEGMKDER